MTRMVLDSAILAKLRGLRERVEFLDESGRLLGYFQPAAERALYQNLQVPFSNEELDRFESEPGGRPLADILADLEKRA